MQRTSIYNKLWIVLSQLKRRSFKDAYELSEYLAMKKIDAFEVPLRGTQKRYCHPATIRKTIQLASRLKLLREDEKCSLTTDGITAARDDASFKSMLGSRIIAYLSDKGFGITRILKIIDNMKGPDFPEAEAIFKKVESQGIQIDGEEFRRLLYLLYLCDKLDRKPKILYLR